MSLKDSVASKDIARQGVARAAFDEKAGVLKIEFSNGRVYEYYGVKKAVFDWLSRTPEPGSYVTRVISPRYKYRALAPAGSEPDFDLEERLRRSLEVTKGSSC